ncbi:MAG: site-specific integrase [Sandaracinaceae bacterium]|nr:site-specific integrase [Sandaracinaceae bacterium]
MPRKSKTGVRGLQRDQHGHYRIDLRWTDKLSGQERRWVEPLPVGIPLADAKARAVKVLASALAGTLTKAGPRGKAPTLAQAFEQYLAWCASANLKTVQDRRSLSRVWIRTMGDVSTAELSPLFVARFKSERQKAGARMQYAKDANGEHKVRGVVGKAAAPATINRAVAMMKHMCSRAAEEGWGWIEAERARLIADVRMLREPAGRQRDISPEDLDKLCHVLQELPHVFRIAQAAMQTGMRKGELLTLRKSQVDLPARMLKLQAENRKNKKPHTIPVSDALVSVLEEAMKESACEHVFVNSFGAPYSSQGFSKYFAKLVARAGLKNFTFHDLRRHVGTVLINSGERLEVVSKLLGHSSVAVTQRSYAHLRIEATREAVQRLPALVLSATR